MKDKFESIINKIKRSILEGNQDEYEDLVVKIMFFQGYNNTRSALKNYMDIFEVFKSKRAVSADQFYLAISDLFGSWDDDMRGALESYFLDNYPDFKDAGLRAFIREAYENDADLCKRFLAHWSDRRASDYEFNREVMYLFNK